MTNASIPRVSVIVPTKNRSTLLREALTSIRALEGPDLDLEVIVADNGSTDDTRAVTAGFGAHLVEAIAPGAAAARNAGMRVATGEYLAFLDDDDVWLPGHLRPQIALLELNPGLVAAVGQVLNCDNVLASRSQPWPERLPSDGDLVASFLRLCPQIGATVTRSSVRDTVGYLDETLLSDEDWDWHLRLALRHGVGFVAAPCVLFRQRPQGVADDLEWMRLSFNRRVFWRNVRRAGPRRPSAAAIARLYLRHNGAYAAAFLRSAAVHADAGKQGAARRALARAVLASPMHAAWTIARDSNTCRTLWRCAAP
jgi:glycosyltransferase involved in cell wall biosynthesis